MKVRDLMTPEPVVVPPEMTVPALIQLLADHHISGVFVVDANGSPVGVVTEADLVRRLAPGKEADLGWLSSFLLDNRDRAAESYARTHGRHARDLMTARVIGVDADAEAGEAARLMRENRVRRIAVVSGDKLVGVVSRADLLKAVGQPQSIPAEPDDAGVRHAILREMRRHSWRDISPTTVVVNAGVVRLEGYCRSEEVRTALRVLAEQIEGVREVIDNMKLNPVYPAFPAL